MIEYDLNDDAIRTMIEYRHRPEEMWSTGIKNRELLDVTCEKCSAAWPCPSIRALREWHKDQFADATRCIREPE